MIEDTHPDKIVSIIPGDGWRVEWSPDNAPKWSQPLVGWGLTADGDVVPLDVDSTGMVEPVGSVATPARIYHPQADRW